GDASAALGHVPHPLHTPARPFPRNIPPRPSQPPLAGRTHPTVWIEVSLIVRLGPPAPSLKMGWSGWPPAQRGGTIGPTFSLNAVMPQRRRASHGTGNPHARFERGIQEPGPARAPRLRSTNAAAKAAAEGAGEEDPGG